MDETKSHVQDLQKREEDPFKESCPHFRNAEHLELCAKCTGSDTTSEGGVTESNPSTVLVDDTHKSRLKRVKDLIFCFANYKKLSGERPQTVCVRSVSRKSREIQTHWGPER